MPRLDPTAVLDVAVHLIEGPADMNTEQWNECRDARLRSSVSRAYYGAFLRLKDRLLAARSWPNGFPQVDVHARVLKALRKVLSPNHPLPTALSTLLIERKNADYEFESRLTDDLAGDRYDAALDAIDRIDRLSNSKIRQIADLLDPPR